MSELLCSATEGTRSLGPSALPASTHPNNPKSASLEKYIHNVHYQDSYDIGASIFDRGLCHTPPVLVSGRCNRILMYPGSFNPPHYSHLELLQHTFQNCGNDLEIIAAIIFPLDDDILKSKFQHRKNTDIFTKVERVSLWKEMVPSDWYWVYDRSAKEWFEFRRRLMTDAAHDGFEIKFVVLCGSDYVTLKNAPTGALGCEEIIVSDISRAADFFSPRMAAPLAVKGYRPWEKIDVEITSLGTMAGEDAARVYGRLSFMSPSVLKSMRGHGSLSKKLNDLAEELLQDYLKRSNAVWTCVSEMYPRSIIRFIPGNVSRHPISSTLIRQKISESTGSVLVKSLEGLALNHELAVEYIERARERGL